MSGRRGRRRNGEGREVDIRVDALVVRWDRLDLDSVVLLEEVSSERSAELKDCSACTTTVSQPHSKPLDLREGRRRAR